MRFSEAVRAASATVTAAPVVADRDLGLGWRLGWRIEPDWDQRYLWQWGNNPGYRGFAIGAVGTKDGLVVLTNSENGLALAEPVTRKVMGGERRLFRSSIMETDLMNVLCSTEYGYASSLRQHHSIKERDVSRAL